MSGSCCCGGFGCRPLRPPFQISKGGCSTSAEMLGLCRITVNSSRSGKYLHPNDSVDKEEHHDEQSDMRQSLQTEHQHSHTHWPKRGVGGWGGVTAGRPGRTWWRSTAGYGSPLSGSAASQDAWHGRVGRTWWTLMHFQSPAFKKPPKTQRIWWT